MTSGGNNFNHFAENQLTKFSARDAGDLVGLHIVQPHDISILQQAIDALQQWTQKWLLSLNIKKCKVVCYGRNVDKSYRPTYKLADSSNQDTTLERGEKNKGSGCVVR